MLDIKLINYLQAVLARKCLFYPLWCFLALTSLWCSYRWSKLCQKNLTFAMHNSRTWYGLLKLFWECKSHKPFFFFFTSISNAMGI